MAKSKRYRRRGRRYSGRSAKSNAMSSGLSQLLSLALVLYVFDRILAAVMPNLYNCINASYALNESSLAAGLTPTCWNVSGVPVVPVSVEATNNYFSAAISFLRNLLPIFGILGAYWVIKRTLMKMKMS